MKKSFIAKMSALLASIMLVCVALTGCFEGGGGGTTDPDLTPKEYTIQYSDDAGTHTLTVTEGMPYSLESVPYKYGYEFLGLYDAQTGGTQYVAANGASLSPYKDKENKVLFPQFKPIDYTVILDYGDAKVTGDRSLTVAYNESIPELPKNITLEHNEFTGWYTEAGGKGTQVADAYGNLPLVSVLNEENFKLDESKRVYLYAGFELETYTVTFIFDDEMPSEEMKVPYNTPISQVVPKTRNNKKEAGFKWSKNKDGDIFNGNVTDDIVLYVKEWAPVIELNGNGADVTPIVAKAGTTISLPTPTKPLAKFLRWEDENGQTKELTTMPATSITLNAVWQGKIEFDENGGMDVDDISKPAGESISLPTPTKEGYLFAGWYTADKEQYTQTKMPSAGVALKAGWYVVKYYNKVMYGQDTSYEPSGSSNEEFLAEKLYIDLSDILSADFYGEIKISAHLAVKIYSGWDSDVESIRLSFYSQESTSSSYLLYSKTFEHRQTNSYKDYSFDMQFKLNGNKIYCSRYTSMNPGNYAIKDYYLNITYPDTTYLYL